MHSEPSRPAIALSAARSYAGPLLAAGGVVLEIIGWFCVSGESLAARQLPYIASASIPGAALIVSGAVLTAGRHPADDETARRVAELHALLVEYAPGHDGDAGGDGDAARPAPADAAPAGTDRTAGTSRSAETGHTADTSRTTDRGRTADASGAAGGPAGTAEGAGRLQTAASAGTAPITPSVDTAEDTEGTEGTPGTAGTAGLDGGPVAVPDGTTFHDPACDLVRGKPWTRVTGDQIQARGLLPCPVCTPDPG